MEAPIEYPSIEACVRIIAAKVDAPVNLVAANLLTQADELGMDARELIHMQYRTAIALTVNKQTNEPET